MELKSKDAMPEEKEAARKWREEIDTISVIGESKSLVILGGTGVS